MRSCFRNELEQMEQISPSATLWQRWQNLISCLILTSASLRPCTFASSVRSKCSTSLNAVFFPIPGSRANSLTALSKKTDENFILQRYEITVPYLYPGHYPNSPSR